MHSGFSLGLSLVLFSLSLFAADGPRKNKEQPLPPLRVISKPNVSIDDAFGTMFISNPVKTSFPNRIVSGKDITDFELETLKAIMEQRPDAAFKFDPKVPAKRRFLINKRYHPGDPRILSVFDRAVADGYGTMGQISHLDDAVDVEFEAGEKHQKELGPSTVTPKDNANGKVIQGFLDRGFKWATGGKLPKRFIAGPPPTNREVIGENGRVALMHEKEWIIGELDEQGNVSRAFAIKGTANAVPHGNTLDKETTSTRYNRAFTVLDPDLAKYIAETAIANARGYAQGLTIPELPNEARLQIRYKDGILEHGYTHGKHNLNARDAAIMLLGIKEVKNAKTKAIEKVDQAWVDANYDRDVAEAYAEYGKPEYRLKGWVPKAGFDSDFVQTYTPGHKIEQQLLEAHPEFTITKLVDNQFIDPAGFGLTGTTQGVSTRRPFGGTVRPWPQRLVNQVKVWVYQRWVDKQRELEGPPISQYLQHDKTGGKEGLDSAGQPVSILRTGSFNRSNAQNNAEDQTLLIASPKSWLYQGTKESVEFVIANEPRYAIPYFTAIQRDLFAYLTGRSPQQIKVEEAKQIHELISFGELPQAKALLLEIARVEPLLTRKPELAERLDRVERLFAFLDWHRKNYADLYGDRAARKEPTFYLRKITDVELILAHPNFTDAKKAWALRDAVWAPGLTPEQVDERAATAWKLLGFAGDMPARSAKETPPKPGDEFGTYFDPMETHRIFVGHRIPAPPVTCVQLLGDNPRVEARPE